VGVGAGVAAPAITDPTEVVTALEVTDVPGELARATGGTAKEESVATLLFSMLLVSMTGGTLAGPPSPTAVEGSIVGVTSIAEAVDTSEDSCVSGEFGTSKNCGDDADLDVSPTAMESCSIAGAASPAEAVDTSADPCGSSEFGGAKSCVDRTDINVSAPDASVVNGWIDGSRTEVEVEADADSLRYPTGETSPL
jgi:hypothetical protein